jgi:hypothetical protein
LVGFIWRLWKEFFMLPTGKKIKGLLCRLFYIPFGYYSFLIAFFRLYGNYLYLLLLQL